MAHPVYKLFRWRPVTAWGVVGVMIAVACAIASGLPIDWINLLLVGITILIIQGIIAHGVNDLADEEVDRIAPIKETGRSKILVSGEMSRRSLSAIISAAVLTVFMIIILLAMRAGPVVFFFAAFAAYAVFGYSCKPLKLGWQPFAELTVVVPTITMLICGVMYVMTSTVTSSTIMIGVSYGFFNASWFMYSRAQDYEPDKAMGKRTTIVSLGLDATPGCAMMYLFVGFVYAVFGTAYMVNGTMLVIAYAIPALTYAIPIYHRRDNVYVPEECAELRLKGMRSAILYGVLAALTITLEGSL